MPEFPKKLTEKLSERESQNSLRRLAPENDLIDFSSNDYLGFSGNLDIFKGAQQLLSQKYISRNGATGSRLLSGNHPLYSELEQKLANFHQTEAALVFNSGYDANIGFFGCVPQRGDVVFYDEYIHASIRDGIQMGNAKSYKFKHNDLEDLKRKCKNWQNRILVGAGSGNTDARPGDADVESCEIETLSTNMDSLNAGRTVIYIITEAVFSMDGDSPNLDAFAQFCLTNGYHLVVDEAHAVGVFGKKGQGLVQQMGLQDDIFARILTFGKALGCHGAAIAGSSKLKNYLVNFARSLIYTTGLPPHSVATILSAYRHLSLGSEHVEQLRKNILFFKRMLVELELSSHFVPSDSAIQCCIVPGNERVRKVSEYIRENGLDVKAILSPTVPHGQERLRVCIHSYNTRQQIGQLLQSLSLKMSRLESS